MQKLLSSEESLIEIKKSKFYGFVFSVFNEEEIINKLAYFRDKYKDATHICYAYILSEPKKEKCFDDKEPNGTAGIPILNVLKKKELTNVLIIVVRYFGGKKLGGGGLIRAYTNTAVETLNKCKIIECEKFIVYKFYCDFSNKNKFEKLLNLDGIKLIDVDYTKIDENKVGFEIGFISQDSIEQFKNISETSIILSDRYIPLS